MRLVLVKMTNILWEPCKCLVSCALGPVSAEVLSFDTRSNLGARALVFTSLVIFDVQGYGLGHLLVCKDFSYGIVFEQSA